MKLSSRGIASFQQKIFNWWITHKRDLPWRHTLDPYRIMVSEVMLQQTQVLRVIPKYREFIERYPSVKVLAKTSTAHVLKTWKGMGYNRRALYLHKAAKTIVEKYHNQFPISEQLLSQLPGLGTYTARAILVFAYKQEVPLIDTNIRQIITHFFFKDEPQKESVIEDVARQLLPKGTSWEWHQALMDYGSLQNSEHRTQIPTKKYAIPFKDSNRFYRGRIIDRLREGNLLESTIINELQKKYGKSREFICGILTGLENDGLLARVAHGVIGLPK